ncbi:MAG TPA: DUF2279 domain-containing protein [Chitinophagaceae bacterium]
MKLKSLGNRIFVVMSPASVLLSPSLRLPRRGVKRRNSGSHPITIGSCTFRSLMGLLVFSFFLSSHLEAQTDTLNVDNINKEIKTINTPAPNDSWSSRPPGYNYSNLTPGQKKKRQWLIGGINVAGYGGSFYFLNKAWYKDYPKTSFHTFNDSREWLQVDKMGHSWTAYNTSRGSAAMWRWAGVSQKKAAWIGGLSGAAYLTVIELLDGRSSKWGWSWSDIAANYTGSALFVGQELAWQEQRIQFKFSFHKKKYGDPQLEQRADDLFGMSLPERMLKDYNAQTYWLSVNLKSFFKQSKLPPWLNIAVGYGADGMYGGFENKWLDQLGNEMNRTDIPRKRQFYVAPDIDFTKIKTSSKLLRTCFAVLNCLKMPAPALMMDSKGKFKAYPFYF